MRGLSISDNKSTTWFVDLFLIFVLASILYMGLGWTRPLANPDEGRYGEIAREMAVSGDIITPRLNGVPYFYKPPFSYWCNIVSIKFMGINKFSLRFSNALIAVLGICSVYGVGRILYGRNAGIFSALILSTSIFYLALGQIITLDMTVSVFISLALFSFFVGEKKKGIYRTIAIVLFFIFCGFATITKGLIGVLIPFAVVFLFLAYSGFLSFFKALGKREVFSFIVGILAFLAITLPWHILAIIENPALKDSEGVFSSNPKGQGFFWYYIIHEHFLRYIDAQTSRRTEPWWYFIAYAPLGFAPWILFFPRFIKESFSDGIKNFIKDKDSIFFVIWIVFVLAFFSLSQSKLVPYTLCIYPALALWLGKWLGRCYEKGRLPSFKLEQIALIILAAVLAFAMFPIYEIMLAKGKLINPQNSKLILYSLSGLLIFLILIVSALVAMKKHLQAWIVSFIGVFLFSMYFNPLASIFQKPDSEEIAKVILKMRKQNDAVVLFSNYNHFHDLSLWLGETVILFGEAPVEQKFGLMRESEKHFGRFIDTQKRQLEFIESCKGDIFLVLMEDDLTNLKKFPVSWINLYKEGRLLLLKLQVNRNER